MRLTAQSKQIPLASLAGYWQLDSGNDICPVADAGSDQATATEQPTGLALLQIQISSDEFKATCIRGTHLTNFAKFFADGQEYPSESSSFAEKIMTKATWDENTSPTADRSLSFLAIVLRSILFTPAGPSVTTKESSPFISVKT